VILEARNVDLAYEKREVVSGLSLGIRGREIISLIGGGRHEQ